MSKSTRRSTQRRPHPFVKWAGGKRKLIPKLFEHTPRDLGAYHEPFIGGGALFFALCQAERLEGHQVVLSDSNLRLIRTWRAVRDDVAGLIRLLQEHQRQHSSEHFYRTRERLIDDQPDDIEIAAWFIYLNKTAYNGLYRVNSRNRFNVPIGSYKNPTICDPPNLEACSRVLQGVKLLHTPFETILDRAQSGDFIYFDPPYVPLSRTAYFTSYTPKHFGEDAQRLLRDVALQLKARGVRVLLSNSHHPLVLELYKEGLEIQKVSMPRAINAAANRRGTVKELLIY